MIKEIFDDFWENESFCIAVAFALFGSEKIDW